MTFPRVSSVSDEIAQAELSRLKDDIWNRKWDSNGIFGGNNIQNASNEMKVVPYYVSLQWEALNNPALTASQALGEVNRLNELALNTESTRRNESTQAYYQSFRIGERGIARAERIQRQSASSLEAQAYAVTTHYKAAMAELSQALQNKSTPKVNEIKNQLEASAELSQKCINTIFSALGKIDQFNVSILKDSKWGDLLKSTLQRIISADTLDEMQLYRESFIAVLSDLKRHVQTLNNDDPAKQELSNLSDQIRDALSAYYHVQKDIRQSLGDQYSKIRNQALAAGAAELIAPGLGVASPAVVAANLSGPIAVAALGAEAVWKKQVYGETSPASPQDNSKGLDKAIALICKKADEKQMAIGIAAAGIIALIACPPLVPVLAIAGSVNAMRGAIADVKQFSRMADESGQRMDQHQRQLDNYGIQQLLHIIKSSSPDVAQNLIQDKLKCYAAEQKRHPESKPAIELFRQQLQKVQLELEIAAIDKKLADILIAIKAASAAATKAEPQLDKEGLTPQQQKAWEKLATMRQPSMPKQDAQVNALYKEYAKNTNDKAAKLSQLYNLNTTIQKQALSEQKAQVVNIEKQLLKYAAAEKAILKVIGELGVPYGSKRGGVYKESQFNLFTKSRAEVRLAKLYKAIEPLLTRAELEEWKNLPHVHAREKKIDYFLDRMGKDKIELLEAKDQENMKLRALSPEPIKIPAKNAAQPIEKVAEAPEAQRRRTYR